jgi:hypothetical protein
MDAKSGVISPGGIGFDINCGMRLVLTNLTYDQVKPHPHQLVDKLFRRVPAGVGSKGFVLLDKSGHLFNYVAGRADLEEFQADRTQLVFIGRHLDQVQDAILGDLKGCEAKYALPILGRHSYGRCSI